MYMHIIYVVVCLTFDPTFLCLYVHMVMFTKMRVYMMWIRSTSIIFLKFTLIDNFAKIIYYFYIAYIYIYTPS